METKIGPELNCFQATTKVEIPCRQRYYCNTSNFNGTLYFPSWNGYIYAIKAFDGSLIWKQNLQDLTGFNSTGLVANVNWTVSRSTPTVAYDRDLLVIGIYGPAVVIAVKRSTGELLWSTQLNSQAAGVITTSGTYYKGGFYVGTSSLEESVSIEQCCTFRGSFSKLDINSGKILWQTFMLPDNNGKTGEYAGAAIWGSSPFIDVLSINTEDKSEANLPCEEPNGSLPYKEPTATSKITSINCGTANPSP